MAKQSLFYEEVVPITAERHRDHAVALGADYRFAAASHALPVMMSEFHAAALDLPIVFGRSNDGGYTPMVMMGLRPETSLFIDAEGRFTGRYVPAILRRYPFIFAHSADNTEQFALCLDDSAPQVDASGESGEKLFGEDDKPSEFLTKMMEFCRSFEIDQRKTTAVTKELDALGLFDPMQAQITLKDGQKVQLTGFHVIAKERLKALDADKVHDLHTREILEMLYYHLISLKNMERLRDLIA